MKTLLTLLLFVHLIVTTVGCGGDEAPKGPPPGSGEDAVELAPQPSGGTDPSGG